MSALDLQEQEQIDELKAYWRQYGGLIMTAIAVAAVGFAGYNAWKYFSHKRAEEASAAYQTVSKALKDNKLAEAKAATEDLESKYGGTAYAPRAAMVLAKQQFDQKDFAGAKASLQWVIDNANDDFLRQLARLRMAHVLVEEKSFDAALKVLDAKRDESLEPLYEDLRGDILMASGKPAEARTAYQAALAKFDAKSQSRQFVQMKLDALGGAPAEAEPLTAATTAPSAAPAAAPAATPSAGAK